MFILFASLFIVMSQRVRCTHEITMKKKTNKMNNTKVKKFKERVEGEDDYTGQMRRHLGKYWKRVRNVCRHQFHPSLCCRQSNTIFRALLLALDIILFGATTFSIFILSLSHSVSCDSCLLTETSMLPDVYTLTVGFNSGQRIESKGFCISRPKFDHQNLTSSRSNDLG